MKENDKNHNVIVYEGAKQSSKRSLKNKGKYLSNPADGENINNENCKIRNESQSGIKKFFKLFIIIGVVAILIIVVTVCLVLLLRKKKKGKTNNENTTSDIYSTPTEKKDELLLKPIYKFNNTVGDLKRINVLQTAYKNMTFRILKDSGFAE